MKIFRVFIFAVFGFISCSAAPADSVSVVNWNVQTFFDAVTEGTEYSDFKKNQNWNKSAYSSRVKKLTDAIKSIDADIFVLEEIENQNVVQDLANSLEDRSWNGSKNWKYAFFAKNKGDSIGCAVISRFPIKNTSVHNLDIRTESANQPSMRPVMKLEIEYKNGSFILFVNHWKSKSGGEKESEVWRNWQESVLSKLFQKYINEGKAVLASGDFNRDIYEFTVTSSQDYNVLLNGITPVHSPWINDEGTLYEPGSYYYNKSWERIDHFFSAGPVTVSDFRCVTGPWCGQNLVPERYSVYSGEGYSDHLPIGCSLSF